MKYSLLYTLVIVSFINNSTLGQEAIEGKNVTFQTLALESRIDIERIEGKGYSPSGIDELVSSADVIIKGQWGVLIEARSFLGYGTNAEEFSALHNFDTELMRKASLPVNDFEINIEQVLKSDFELGKSLTLRVFESPGLEKRDDISEFRKGTHLLFLALQPDGKTFSLLGTAYDQKELSELYVYLEREELHQFSDVKDKAEFKSEIDAAINKNLQELANRL